MKRQKWYDKSLKAEFKNCRNPQQESKQLRHCPCSVLAEQQITRISDTVLSTEKQPINHTETKLPYVYSFQRPFPPPILVTRCHSYPGTASPCFSYLSKIINCILSFTLKCPCLDDKLYSHLPFK